jgi:hydrogenase maturation protease
VKIFVCGYGNPFRTDDGAGHHLAPLLSAFLESYGENVELRLEHQLLPEMAEEFAAFDLLVFADARVAGTAPGEDIVLEEIDPDPVLEGLNIHSVGPEWVLALAAQIGGKVPPALLLSVEGESFDFGETPTSGCELRIGKAASAFENWFLQKYPRSGLSE